MEEVRTEKYCRERFKYLKENVIFDLLSSGEDYVLNVTVNPTAVFYQIELSDFIFSHRTVMEKKLNARVYYSLEGTN